MKIRVVKKNLSGINIRLGSFDWALEEDFSELIGEWKLTDTKAIDIEKMDQLSLRSKILLSAMAGASWQYVIDNGCDPKLYDQLYILV